MKRYQKTPSARAIPAPTADLSRFYSAFSCLVEVDSNQAMTKEFSSTVRHFLRTQVLRTDYVIVGSHAAIASRLPYEQKLERVHDLCIRNGYRSVADCESVRQTLYENRSSSDCPAALLLSKSYLPECVSEDVEQDEHRSPRLMHALERQARRLPGTGRHFQSSTLIWQERSYLMCLPLDIHFLLIEHDGALLAA